MFIFIGVTTTFCVHAQNATMVEYEGRHVVNHGENDSVGLSLDYSNTICDTLLYDGRIILLETSPLLQLAGIKSTASDSPEQSYDSVYNCARGYTATWKLEEKKLSLLSVHPLPDAGKGVKKMMKLKQVRNLADGPVEADWVSGKVPGGYDAVKTNYGYAFKQEYEFELKGGRLIKETRNDFPVGLLEDKQSLTDFLKKNSNALLGSFLHIDRLDKFRNDLVGRNEEHSFRRDRIPLDAGADGETYYSIPLSSQGITLESLGAEKHIGARLLIASMNFTNMLPKGSFYPRFLRGKTIYRPIYIEYSWNLYGDIENVGLQYYTIIQGEPPASFWKKTGRWDY